MLLKIAQIIDKVNLFISAITMWLIIPLTLLMIFDAFMRYFMNSPTIWGAELALMCFGAYMILAGPSSILQKVQVGVDILTAHMKTGNRAFLNCITYMFTFIFFLGLIYTSTVYAIEAWQLGEESSSAWGQPMYHIKALIPLAMLLMMIQSFAEFLRNLHTCLTGETAQ